MDELTATHPLDGVAPLRTNGLVAKVMRPRTLIELRGRPHTLSECCPGLLPMQPNRIVFHESWRASWLRPDGWLLSGAPDPNTAGWADLARAESARNCRLIDVSHSLVCVSVAGEGIGDLLAKGSPLDSRTGRFTPGCCARTWCAGFAVLFERTGSGIDAYVDAPLSVAFWSWLYDAAQ